MHGKIIFYDKNKKFGFISNNKFKKLFFHISQVKPSKNNERPDIKKGQKVQLEVGQNKKGYFAKNITITKDEQDKQNKKNDNHLTNFFYNSSKNPNFGTVQFRQTFKTRTFKDVSSLKEYVIEQAKNAGCNAVLDFKVHNEKRYKGNYIYHIYYATGDFCLVSKSKSKNKTNTLTKNASDKVNQFVQNENNYLEKEEQNGCLYNFIGIGILIFILIILNLN